mmetsp:Transcript_6633/g.11293  ORF Transcript_6633/g.11293 Transcript_6633/m.11293 type:complete len:87 (-) Transcript_6633:2-262(-)
MSWVGRDCAESILHALHEVWICLHVSGVKVCVWKIEGELKGDSLCQLQLITPSHCLTEEVLQTAERRALRRKDDSVTEHAATKKKQ